MDSRPLLVVCPGHGTPEPCGPHCQRNTSPGGSVDPALPTAATLREALAIIAARPPATPVATGSGTSTIALCPGIWREKVALTTPGTVLAGPPLDPDGRPRATVVWGDHAGKPGPDSQALGTFRTQTLAILAPDCSLHRLTVTNDWDYDRNEALPTDHPDKSKGSQAVALKVDEGADRTAISHCTFLGRQDTLYLNAGRIHLSTCRVEGHVDFIFGAATAWFKDCTLVCLPRPHHPAAEGPTGWVAAPSTRAPGPWGFVFDRCRVERGSPGLPEASFRLGRPWHPSFAPDTLNCATFMDCWLDSHIAPEAWTSMDSRPGGVRVTYHPEDAQLFELRSQGPGSVPSPSPRRRFLPDTLAAGLSPARVLGGWLPPPL